MNRGMFSFELLDKYAPEVVIKRMLEQIEEATGGYVIGKIEKYDGPVFSYTKNNISFSFQTALKPMEIDIQDDLGEQDKEDNRYEVFLTVKNLEHYRYRMMFVDYRTISYPVTIVMSEALAVEYSSKRNAIFRVESMKELENMLDIIINSKTMISLIQSLINESLRQEAVLERQ